MAPAVAALVRDGGVEIGWLNYFGAFADIELNGVPGLADLARMPDGAPPPAMRGALPAGMARRARRPSRTCRSTWHPTAQ